MEFRLAQKADLQQLQSVYREIVQNMNRQGLTIWDDIYPCEFLGADIEAQRLFILTDQETIVAAFALCRESAGANALYWKTEGTQPLYLDRLGVNIHYTRQGIGSRMLAYAQNVARIWGADCLRLFVVDSNLAARRLYEKSGLVQATGVYEEAIDSICTLREYGYEIIL